MQIIDPNYDMDAKSPRAIALRAAPRAAKDDGCGDPFVMRLRTLSELSTQDVASLHATIDAEITVKKRRDLILEGYAVSRLCFVRDGFAARYKVLRDGKRQIVKFILPGDVVGLPASFLDRAANSVIAVTDMVLQVCPLAAFVDLCWRRPQFALSFGWLAAQEAAIYAEHIINVGRRTPVERLAHLLLEIHSRLQIVGRAAESGFDLPFTQEMMSDALGLSVPHLNRTLARLRADDLIAVNERRVEFVDLEAVRLLAQFQPITPARIPLPGVRNGGRQGGGRAGFI
jgi:CRP-like cAMP-binding protein